MSNWISIEVAVPRTNQKHEESDDVLVSIGDMSHQAVCWYNSKTDSFHLSHHYAPSTPVDGVTHWMPLPNSPTHNGGESE